MPRILPTLSSMRVEGTFEVVSFTPAMVDPPPLDIRTGVPVGVSTMVKRFAGGVEGTSATLFTAAFDQAKGVGTYVAMESFEGSLGGRSGAFNFVHAATTHGSDRAAAHFEIV